MTTGYNALYIPESDDKRNNRIFSGVRVIPTPQFGEFVTTNPSLRFENWGDFYSEVEPLNLGVRLEKILREFQNEGVFNSLRLLKGIDLSRIQRESDLVSDVDVYIIDQGKRDGVTLHIPTNKYDDLTSNQKETVYGFGSMFVLPQLFTDRFMFRGGSYRKDCESASEAFSRLDSNIKEVNEAIARSQEVIKELDKRLER